MTILSHYAAPVFRCFGVINLLSLFLMGWDKRAAQLGRRRTPELTFFALALLGGTPGAIAGMWLFHHKTRHWYFRYGLPAILLVQLLLSLLLLTARMPV